MYWPFTSNTYFKTDLTKNQFNYMMLKLQAPIGESFHAHKATHHIIMPNWNLFSAFSFFLMNACVVCVERKQAATCHRNIPHSSSHSYELKYLV